MLPLLTLSPRRCGYLCSRQIIIADTPRLKNCSFANKFTYQLITGDWAAIDFEQRLLFRLLFDVNAARSGQAYSSTHNLNRSQKL